MIYKIKLIKISICALRISYLFPRWQNFQLAVLLYLDIHLKWWKKIHSFSCIHLTLCHILVHLFRNSPSQNVLYTGFLLVNTNIMLLHILINDVTHFEAYLLNGFLTVQYRILYMVKREYLTNQYTINLLISIITSLDLTDELPSAGWRIALSIVWSALLWVGRESTFSDNGETERPVDTLVFSISFNFKTRILILYLYFFHTNCIFKPDITCTFSWEFQFFLESLICWFSC